MYKTRKTGRETGNVAIHFGECRQTFREMTQTFRGLSPNILGSVVKHSSECPQISQRMLPNIAGIVVKHLLFIANSAVKCNSFKVSGRGPKHGTQFY